MLLGVSPALAFAGVAADAQKNYFKALDRMMIALAPQNARVSALVRKEYRAYLDLLVLNQFDALEDALYTGGLVALPSQPERFNLDVRTEGPAPIAEKDLANQASYIAARPATVGALLDIASRVKSGPLEITSMVRHTEYQDALRATNSNANTSVPMHTMGLAVDIALVNTPLKTAYEIRDVLQQLQKAGDILFIGERRQLVFHVVPHPSRLGYFNDVYAAAMAASLAGENGVRTTAVNRALTPLTRPVVDTQVIAVGPTDDFAAEWWSADAHSDVMVKVSAASVLTEVVAVSRLAERPTLQAERRSFFGRLAAFIGGMFRSAREVITTNGGQDVVSTAEAKPDYRPRGKPFEALISRICRM
ncbi:MAG TPA: DUF5715 family protein [Vicinamibacterales bacterium]|nr:DUF5715 family protein [Vicinamibacterales bacterium]